MQEDSALPDLVAHRGNAADYPENTLPALDSALRHGFRYVEFDVQLTADEIPVLLHDETLSRTAGIEQSVFDLRVDQLAQIEVNEAGRFADRFRGVHVPLLEQAVALLEPYPTAHAFVELKRQSLRRFGIARVVSQVCRLLAPLGERAIVISFERAAVEAALDRQPVGWVLRRFDADVRREAEQLRPEYLFCNHSRIPADALLWPGEWRWALYEIEDPDSSRAWHERGADLLETMAVARFARHPLFRERLSGRP